MSSASCPQCSAALEAGAVICPQCDLILDTSFLGGDILDSEEGDAVAAPPVDDQSYTNLFAEETGGFLTSPTAEMSRAVFPVGSSKSPTVSALLEDAAVVEQTGALAPGALSDVERHVLALANGERPTARIRALVLEEAPHLVGGDVRTALISLAEKHLIRQYGVARREGESNEIPAAPDVTAPEASAFDEATLAIDALGASETPADEDAKIPAAAAPSEAADIPAFELEEAPVADWLDGPTNLDLRGAGLDDVDLDSSSEDESDEDVAPQDESSVLGGDTLGEISMEPSSDVKSVETMVFETNTAFIPEVRSEVADAAPSPFGISSDGDAIFADRDAPNHDVTPVVTPIASFQTPADLSSLDGFESSLSVDQADDFDGDAEVTRGDVEGAIALAEQSERSGIAASDEWSPAPASNPFTKEAPADPDGTALLSDDVPSALPSHGIEAPLSSSVVGGVQSSDISPSTAPQANADDSDPDPATQAERAFDQAMADLKGDRAARAKSFVRVAQKLAPENKLYDAVLASWEQVRARALTPGQDPIPVELRLFIEAQECDARHDADGAIALVERAIEAAPTNAQLHNFLGVLHAGRRRDPVAALKPLMRAVELDPSHADFRQNLRRVLAMESDPMATASLPESQRLSDDDS